MWVKNSVDENDVTNYQQMVNEYFPYQFTIPWKQDPKKTPNTGWKLERDRTNFTYHVPVMTIRENQTVTLELHVELEKAKDKTPPKKIIVRQYEGFSEGSGHLNVSYEKVKPKTGKYEITVKCNKTFKIIHLIEAVAVYDNPNGGEISKICGLLRVIPNSVIPKVNIMIVAVRIDIGNGESKGQKLTGEIEELRKVLHQSYIEIEDFKDDVKITIVNQGEFYLAKTEDKKYHFKVTKGLYTAVITELEKIMDLDDAYRDYIKICIFDEECKDISQKEISQKENIPLFDSIYGETLNEYVLLFRKRDTPTMPHEVLHALSLEHPFVSKDGVKAAPKALYTYKAQSTENIMDYTKDKGYSTWFWQWKILWEKLDIEISDTPEKSLNDIPLSF
jgi:hypothetical protein